MSLTDMSGSQLIEFTTLIIQIKKCGSFVPNEKMHGAVAFRTTPELI